MSLNMCYHDMTVFMETFKITESSLVNHKIRAYERCEAACVDTSDL